MTIEEWTLAPVIFFMFITETPEAKHSVEANRQNSHNFHYFSLLTTNLSLLDFSSSATQQHSKPELYFNVPNKSQPWTSSQGFRL